MKRNMAALLIGNAAYADGHDLRNPANDATDLGAKLKGYGFNVILATDCTNKEMDKQLKAFRTLLETHEVGLFFFAGHGMQIDGRNYLIATDTDMDTETDAQHSSLSLDKVLDTMSKSNASTKIVVLDACRTNPWEREWSRAAAVRGLASVYAPKGTIIGFATSPGEVAYDGTGRNGRYTAALLDHIDAPDCAIEMMFKRVRNSVAASTGGKQTTWEHTSLAGEYYFNLSLGNVIDEYSATALADSRFVLDPSKKSHEIIAGLKVTNWYVQNPALEKLDAAGAARMNNNSLFVIGRNIYQAACGSAGTATGFLKDFMNVTRGYPAPKRKAILDGMLFEVFFDSKGELREHIKGRYFDEVFELQLYPELADSFAFIAEALTAAQADFYFVPGKGHQVVVTVSTKEIEGEPTVDAVYLGGVDILRPDSDAFDTEDGKVVYRSFSPERLKAELSEELVVPSRLLTVTYTQKESATAEKLKYPRGWTVQKS